MGFYERWVLPRIMELTTNTPPIRPLRKRVVEGLAGDVLEIGFGSGTNLPYLPKEVERVLAVDPSGEAQKLARERIERATAKVESVGLDGQALSLRDASVDFALSTLTLCTIPDAQRALLELRRVLKPGGALHFFEHGIAPDASVARWQRRLTPIQKALVGGCHLDRDIPALLLSAGFVLDRVESFYVEKTPRVLGYAYLGVARPVTS